MTRLEELRSKHKALQKEIDQECKKEFGLRAKHLFDTCPGLESFSWTQFTPYFNDGDTCYFGVRNEEPTINGSSPYDEWDNALDCFVDPVCEFLDAFSTNEYKTMFGDHQRITVYKDRVVVEDYTSHD